MPVSGLLVPLAISRWVYRSSIPGVGPRLTGFWQFKLIGSVKAPVISSNRFAVRLLVCTEKPLVSAFVTPRDAIWGVLKTQTVPGPSGIVIQGKKRLAR